jgi:hypothetical protein
VFYKLLGLLTWKAIKYYVHNNVPTRKIAAGAIVGTVGVIAIGAALKSQHDES